MLATEISRKKIVSVIVPVHNEEAGLLGMHTELMSALENITDRLDYEIIYVDDGSSDQSWTIIESLSQNDERVCGVAFSRNFGQQCALEAGMSYSRGDAVVMLDADLQHPPSLIPEMVKKWEEGFVIVKTKRLSYKTSTIKKITSKLFYGIINKVSDVRLEPGSPDFRLLDRKVVGTLGSIDESERYYKGLVEWVGFESAVVPYEEGKRFRGVSSYSISGLINLALTALVSFSTAPMKAIMVLGLIITMGAWILLGVMAYWRYALESDYFSQMAFLVVFMIGNNGILFIAIGIVAMYILRIHKEVQNKPNYIVKHTLKI